MNKRVLLLGFLFIGMLSFGQQKESDRLKKQQKKEKSNSTYCQNLKEKNKEKM